MDATKVMGIIGAIAVWVLLWKALPVLFERVGMVVVRFLPRRGKQNDQETVRRGLSVSREGILRSAALIVVGMVIYMPTHVRLGGNSMTDFAYRFVWELGESRDGWHAIEPAMSILIGQVVVVVVIAGFLAATVPSKNGVKGTKSLDIGEIGGDHIGCYLFGIEGDENNPPSYHSLATSREELVSDIRELLSDMAQHKRDLVESSPVAARHEKDLKIIMDAYKNVEDLIKNHVLTNDESPFLRVSGVNLFLRKGVRMRQKSNGKYVE
ncbi:hypothetical protein FGL86_09785 [Pistricoccus aurantiacus]|uniref:Uncharacterized protein n=1 Tax=Pistricoccus aurantiacus TaxID=1883414 RepID=A0A5B8SX19_9GAMM|nr:hypothetical protein [Pistricoccus aurantiacus]QEA39338.1 hypothetical protein FGL86_09785 [Pistricoccus aurantiacus]